MSEQDILAAGEEARRCGSIYKERAGSSTIMTTCTLPVDHEGHHENYRTGWRWSGEGQLALPIGVISPFSVRDDSCPIGAKKFDGKKPPMNLLPPAALIEAAKVFGFGAEKYGEWNYKLGMKHSRLLAAAFRHLNAWNAGEDFDPESGHLHLSHATCCVLMLLDAAVEKYGEDDRFRRAL